MKILITGARGFVGSNLMEELKNIRDGKDRSTILGDTPVLELYECTRNTSEAELREYCAQADFVIHLAGVNRSPNEAEFMEGNADFTAHLLDLLRLSRNRAAILYASSIHAEREDAYGRSKRRTEELLRAYGNETGAKVLIYRFTNLFGKWCRPNYNSVVATFCHNIARDLPVSINDRNTVLTLTYIDDVVEEILHALAGREHMDGDWGFVPVHHTVTLGAIADKLFEFKSLRSTLGVPELNDELTRKLYSTWLSCLPEEKFRYPLKMNVDSRGSFTEIIRTPDRGQFSVNISRPGITKGNHWHHSKNEKFLVVSGHGLIQMRKLGTDREGNPFPVIEFEVSSDVLEVVEMIPGYTHNIINLSETENLVTIMWANESFNLQKPDTFFEPV